MRIAELQRLAVDFRAVATQPQRRTRALPAALLGLGTALSAVVLLYLSRDHYFFADDWDYLLTRGTVADESRGWFAPHGDHWSTGVVLVNRVLFALFGLRSYTPWSVVVVALHLAVCWVLFLLLARAGGNRWAAAAVAWIVLFYGWGAEAYLWDAAMNLTGSLLAGLVAVLLLARREPRNGYLGPWVALVVGLMFSGGGVSAVAFATVFVALKSGRRAAFRLASMPTAAFLLWYVVFGREGAPSALEPRRLYLQVPRYVWRGLSDALDHVLGVEGLGPALLVVLLVAPFVLRSTPIVLRQLAAAGICAALLQLTLVGMTRIAFGFDYAGSGRYAYLSIVYLAPALAVCLVALGRHVAGVAWVPAVLAFAILGAVAVDGLDQARAYAEGAAGVRGPWEERVLGTIEAVDRGERILTTTTGDTLNAAITPALLTSPEIREAVPDRDATAQGVIDAEAMFMVGVGQDVYGLFAPALVTLTKGFSTAQLSGSGCHDYVATATDPELELAVQDGNEISVTSESSEITTQLERDGVVSEPRQWRVAPGTVFIASTAQAAVLRIRFNVDGTYRICTDG